jgi:hypothetical protein
MKLGMFEYRVRVIACKHVVTPKLPWSMLITLFPVEIAIFGYV